MKEIVKRRKEEGKNGWYGHILGRNDVSNHDRHLNNVISFVLFSIYMTVIQNHDVNGKVTRSDVISADKVSCR